MSIGLASLSVGIFVLLGAFFSSAFAQGSNGTGTEDQWKALYFWYFIIIAIVLIVGVVMYKKWK